MVWLPEAEQLPFYRTLVADYPNWFKNLWTWVHAQDVATAHRLALEVDLPTLHEAFFITARDNWTGLDARELAARFYPGVTQFAEGYAGPRVLISHDKAARLLGYSPRFGVSTCSAEHGAGLIAADATGARGYADVLRAFGPPP